MTTKLKPTHNILIRPGCDWDMQLTFKDDNGSPVDLSPFLFYSQFRNEPRGRLLASPAVDRSEAATGQVRFSLTHEQTDAIGDERGVYDVLMGTPKNTSGNNWQAMVEAPELDLIVAVASDGRLMKSADGLAWVLVTAPPAGNTPWKDICWSPDLTLFVVVGTGNHFATSPDGDNWTLVDITTTNPNTWHLVEWSPELGTFLAIGSFLATSTDGSNWTVMAYPNPTVPFSGTATWLGWIAARSKWFVIADSNRIWSSTDADTWVIYSGIVQLGWQHAAWAALSGNPPAGTLLAVGDGPYVWTGYAYNQNLPDKDWKAVCFSTDLDVFAAVTNGQIAISPGVDLYHSTPWLLHTVTGNWVDILYSTNLGLFVALGEDGSIATSADGDTWTVMGAYQDLSRVDYIMGGEVVIARVVTEIL